MGNLASKMSSHFCKLFFGEISWGRRFQLEVPPWELKSWELFVVSKKVHSFIANGHAVPSKKGDVMIYHQSIYPCVPSLDLLDSKEDKNWWWSRRLKNAMSLHCPKRIPFIVLRKHLPRSPKNSRISLKIEDTPLILLHHSRCFTSHSANS